MKLAERLRDWAGIPINEGERMMHEAADVIESLAADAERYRWLRKEAGPWQAWARQKLGTPDLDAAIDAAMNKT